MTERLPFARPMPPSTCSACGAVPLLETPDVVRALGRLTIFAERHSAVSGFTSADARLILAAAQRGIRPVRP